MKSPAFKLSKKIFVLIALVVSVFYFSPRNAAALTTCQQTCFNEVIKCENGCNGPSQKFCLELCQTNYGVCLQHCG